MICVACSGNRCDHCANTYSINGTKRKKRDQTKTWCDCQHRTGVWIDQKFCQHKALKEEGTSKCPSCGKEIKVTITRELLVPGDEVQAEEGESPDG